MGLVAVVFGVACGGSEFQLDHDASDHISGSGGNGGALSASGGTPSAGGAAVESGGTGIGASPTDGGNLADGSDAAASPDAGDSGAVAPPDAAPDSGHDAGHTPPCINPTVWYPDKDGDHYGRSPEPFAGCGAPPKGWAAEGGDCDDDEPDVHPKQTAYFDNSYKPSGGGSADSFDYDCSGTETGDGTQPSPPTCTGTVLNSCTGTGYAPTKRTGTGINPLCGSKQTESCEVVLLACTTAAPVSAAAAFHCK
jgi:hypothetical protein